MDRWRRTSISPLLRVATLTVIAAFAGAVAALAIPGRARGCHQHRDCGHGSARRRSTETVRHAVRVVLSTTDLGSALSDQPEVSFSRVRPPTNVPVIEVNDSVRYQKFTGVGAAMTDTSAWLVREQLSSRQSASMMQSLFGTAGIRLGFLRVPMGASDYTAHETPYSYDDVAHGRVDPRLTHFSIAHDAAYVIPAIRQALAENSHAFVLASPWSAPAWMKANDLLSNLDGGGQFLDRYQRVWADYFVKFLRAYRRQGIRIDAVTPQNEPDNWTAYPGMQFSATQEVNFVRFHLAPALANAGFSTQIFGADGGWDKLGYARRIANSRAASKLNGIATHCYYGSPTVISTLHHDNPALHEIVSECSPGITPFATTEAEISAFRNWASAVGLWNLALNTTGGPVQPPNHGCPGCRGLMTINEASHTATPTIDYYELGQVSRFVDPGARRIASNHFVTYRYPPSSVVSAGLDDVAFRNPDGRDVLVCYDNAQTAVTFAVRSRKRSFTYTLQPGSTATFIWRDG